MLYHEVLEHATTEDITVFIANRNLNVREQERSNRIAKMKANREQKG